MILKLNHLQGKSAAAGAQDVIGTVYSLLEEGQIEKSQFARLQVELDWIQYKQNFREVVIATKGYNAQGEAVPIMDIHVDTRQVEPGCLRGAFLRALAHTHRDAPQHEADRLALEDFQSMRGSIVWQFNRLYWSRLPDWEKATGKGYEEALPGGVSDGHHPQAIADSVGDFWTLLRDMDAKKQLPPEIFVLEIGVGTGMRCGMWLKKFRELDQQRGTDYYPKLRVLLGDYSLATLDMSRPAVEEHADLCSFLVLDAVNPLKTLSFLRHKVLQVHATNVYDNLPDEEVVRRDGRLYFVQVRAYVPMTEVVRLSTEFDVPIDRMRSTVDRLLSGSADFLGDSARGVAFWMEIWKAVRLEERLVLVEDLPDFPFPEGLDAAKVEDILQNAPADFRFHLSSGALESFIHTLPLLHPRGYLQVQDIFVTDLDQYRLGFYGPGKLDGSLLNWVNGALLREVAERAGYDVHFAPFHYRKGARTSVLYTTRRE
ncbi:MAG TPA: hypothetical protein VMB25_13240 [Bryobacteraceae bacterium]|nr:hypothetical protein [Bryobacteraceae bacterium]